MTGTNELVFCHFEEFRTHSLIVKAVRFEHIIEEIAFFVPQKLRPRDGWIKEPCSSCRNSFNFWLQKNLKVFFAANKVFFYFNHVSSW